MIESIYFCGENLPSDRLVTALSLYFDKAIVPLSHMPDEEPYNDLLQRLPQNDRIMVRDHGRFVDRFRGVSPTVLSFPSIYRPKEAKSADIEPIENIKSILEILPSEIPTIMLHVFNEFYALGYYHGILKGSRDRTKYIIIPVSDHDVIGSPIYPRVPNGRLADILASWLAVEAIQLSLPDLEFVHPVEILWAREKLIDELSGFRAAMYRLAANLRGMVENEKDVKVEHLRSEAQFLTKTHILPAVQSLRKALILQKRSFARRVTVRALETFKLVVKYCCAPDPMKVAELASAAAGSAIDFSQYCDEIAKLNNENAISYLAKLPDQFARRQRERQNPAETLDSPNNG